MRRLLAGAAVVATGLALSLPASAIVGGAPDGGEHPYVGQLLFYVPERRRPPVRPIPAAGSTAPAR